MKIAIACSGLGHIRRGFESFAEDLFRNLELEDEIEATLFKGGGVRTPRQIPLWNIPRSSLIWRVTEQQIDPYIGEQITFALPLARYLKRKDFDIVHVNDGQLASTLLHLITGSSNRARIVYGNGGPLAPFHYKRFDFIQQVNPVEMDRALTSSIPPQKMALVPYAVAVDRFHKRKGNQLRGLLGIPEGVPVVLSVGAHGTHKRLEFLIQQMAAVDDHAYLLIAGEEAPDATHRLRALADRLLGGRVIFISLPYEAMPSLYASSDLYIHGSLREGFGVALLEAMASGLPVIHHDEPGMNWVVGDAGVGVDMTNREQVLGTLRTCLENSTLTSRLAKRARERVKERFSWETLLPQYLKMYERALSLPPNL